MFRSEFFFRATRELEYFFFLPDFNIRLYDKNSESDFFFPPPKSEFFFSNIGNQNISLEKKHNPPFKLNGRSFRTYFYERCVGGPKSTDFYPTIKPFLTNKGSNITKDIILEDNNKIINDQLQVANNFNNFFHKCSKGYW